MKVRLIILVVGVLCGIGKVAYGGLEDYGNWQVEGDNGTYSLEGGELSIEAGKREFSVYRKTNARDNFTLKLKAKVISPHKNDIIIYFCDEHYKVILGGWDNTESRLYWRERYDSPNWKPLCVRKDFRLISDRWYNIEIQKYGEYVKVFVNDEPLLGAGGVEPRNGYWIGVGTYNSHVHFDDIGVYGVYPEVGSNAVVYPNPYYPSRHKGVYFDRLREGAIIKIYTIVGELIKEIRAGGSGEYWDVRDESGQPLASGIYIYIIKDQSGSEQIGKLGVIR